MFTFYLSIWLNIYDQVSRKIAKGNSGLHRNWVVNPNSSVSSFLLRSFLYIFIPSPLFSLSHSYFFALSIFPSSISALFSISSFLLRSFFSINLWFPLFSLSHTSFSYLFFYLILTFPLFSLSHPSFSTLFLSHPSFSALSSISTVLLHSFLYLLLPSMLFPLYLNLSSLLSSLCPSSFHIIFSIFYFF